ncbi:MAG: isoprenyl transferase [Rhodospirillales bacterium]
MNVVNLPPRPLAPPPLHVGIIMDGNGRWATARGLPRAAGHRQGAEAVRRTVDAAVELGIRYLTLFAFSSENWTRPAAEIIELMGLLRHYLTNEVDRLCDRGIRLRVIGDRPRLAPDIVTLIEDCERRTAANRTLTTIIALSYGSRSEIVEAARRLAVRAAAGTVDPHTIDEDVLAANLETAGIPDPDLVIRTSGEQRLSNFLMWQAAYAELMFLDVPWPEFSRRHLDAAVNDYRRRERRFGALGA